MMVLVLLVVVMSVPGGFVSMPPVAVSIPVTISMPPVIVSMPIDGSGRAIPKVATITDQGRTRSNDACIPVHTSEGTSPVSATATTEAAGRMTAAAGRMTAAPS
jgi:hypothetical protein